MRNEFRVWAPRAHRADLVCGGDRVGMRPVGGGWWEAAVETDEAEPRYAFSLDGGPARPDPRSPFQPDGVHGSSQVVDHDRFKWTDDRWRGRPLAGSVVYELHVGTFTPEGTFDSAIARLPHLVDLGVDVVELLPVAEFPGTRGWGYDGVDLYAPHHAYGGPPGLKRLVDACHAHGLAVVLDVVYNHLGPDGNYLGEFGPYFTDRYGTPWGEAVNLDGPGSDEVRAFFVDNALMWLRDYRFDGLRLDAVHAIVDTSATHLLEELACRVEALEAEVGRSKFLIAESDLNDPLIVRGREAGGYGMDAQWSDDFHHALHALLTGDRSGYYEDFGRLDHLAEALTRAFVYAGTYSAHRDRRHGRAPDGLSGNRFLGYIQNHDQVGNRACGERISHLAGLDRAKIAAALVLSSPFVPMLFQGEEWAASAPFQYFTDHEDAELGRAVSEGRRREFASFGWKPDDVPDPQEPETFDRSKLRWEELDEPHHGEMLEWHRRLIDLRKSRPELIDGRLDDVAVDWDEHASWLVMRRGAVAVAVNLAESPATVEVSAAAVLLASAAGVKIQDGAARLPPDSVAVLALAPD